MSERKINSAHHLNGLAVGETDDVSTAETQTQHSEDPWVERLRSDGDVRDAALEELRDFLIRGLSKSMADRYRGSLQPEDVVQEALIKILDSLGQFAGRSRFTTWAMTVATRIAISEMRRKHYEDVSIESFSNEEATRIEIAVDEGTSVDHQLDRQAMVSKLQALIDTQLTEKQRFAIRSSLAGLPVEVIAEKCGSNRNSVYKLVHDARMKLRRGLEQAGFAADDLAATFA